MTNKPTAPDLREKIADMIRDWGASHAAPSARDLADEILALLPDPIPQGEDGWLPIVLCPTDGVDRALRLPNGQEVVGNFDSRQVGRNGWQIRSVAYHNPSRIVGQRGGVDQWSQAYDTYLISELPDGVYPVLFRPNDTVHGAAKPTPPAEDDGPVSEATPPLDDGWLGSMINRIDIWRRAQGVGYFPIGSDDLDRLIAIARATADDASKAAHRLANVKEMIGFRDEPAAGGK